MLPRSLVVAMLPVIAVMVAPIGKAFASSTPLAPGNAPSLEARHRVPLSAAYERMLRDQIAAGRRLDPAIVHRFGLDRREPEFEAAAGDALGPIERGPGSVVLGPGVALGPDASVNNRSSDAICATFGCTGRPLGQAETTIAALGSFALAGWNNSKGLCNNTTAVQGYGYSVDGGATWTDAGDPPALPTGGRYRGDPVHAVNAATGDFYILGLYEGGTPGSGLALARGHFASGTFVIDDNRQIAIGGGNFLDKEWMAVDSGTGNLYVSYSNFVAGNIGQIEFIRSVDNGVTWSAPVVMNPPATNDLVQGSRPVVGPDGELYVVWYEFGVPQSHMRIRRSNDFGANFGPQQTVCDFYENWMSGAPGFRRGFGIALPSVAVDRTSGPHRGRVYVSWDEGVNFLDAPAPSGGAKSEVENNASFANATPFTVGDVLRGALSSTADVDQFRFTGARGQTLYFRTDSATAGTIGQMRLICSSDTASINTYRFLANDIADFTALAFTLPADGTYYLRLVSAGGLQTYRILTSFDTPSAGERARDHRDQFVAHSDDGVAWSTPVRMNDGDPWHDGEFAEVTVDGTGAAHAFWHDFRDDDVCGAESYEYLVSSGDGGATWGPNRRLSDARSYWSINTCGSANHGDYQGITSTGGTILPAWADSRLGDPDVWSEGIRFGIGASCPSEVSIPYGTPDTTVTFTILNPGNVEGGYAWEIRDGSEVLLDSGTATVAASGSFDVHHTIPFPGCSDVVMPYDRRFVVRDLFIPGRAEACSTRVPANCSGVPSPSIARLWFAPPRPNPSSRGVAFRFALTREGPARLAIFAANGTRVRTLVDQRLPAGEHAVRWDGRNVRGERMRAGVYWAALDAEERSLRQPVVVVP